MPNISKVKQNQANYPETYIEALDQSFLAYSGLPAKLPFSLGARGIFDPQSVQCPGYAPRVAVLFHDVWRVGSFGVKVFRVPLNSPLARDMADLRMKTALQSCFWPWWDLKKENIRGLKNPIWRCFPRDPPPPEPHSEPNSGFH